MAHYTLCLIGFGNVGQALVRLLAAKRGELRDRYGIEWTLTGVMTRRLGFHHDPAGLDPFTLGAATMPAQSPDVAAVQAWLRAARADVLFDTSSLNAETGEPAIAYMRAALELGVHAITANKGPIVHAYRQLRDLAQARGAQFRFEATVMGGTPIFSLFRHALPAITVQGFRGILNSTTNLILAEMEAGKSFEDGVRAAQEAGLAETDSSADVDGWDATVKVAALVQVVMDMPIHLGDIERAGIRDLHPEEVRAARAAGTPYKLVSSARRHDGGVLASVRPERVAAGDPLAEVRGVDALVRFDTDVLSGLSVGEHGGTPTTTAYGMLADFIEVVSTVR
jgi:homoserine dehydrogenase